jgi:DNA gyrase/topoisomerase IV subunit A
MGGLLGGQASSIIELLLDDDSNILQHRTLGLTKLNFEEISRDIAARSKLITAYRTILEKRIKIEQDCYSKLKDLANIPEMTKIQNPTKASEIIYSFLINSINSECRTMKTHI